mmetsp:Transcript_11155/g.9531  ORF Transcript_11155/g.9531 Transcript_11155/m.9531 type:complete len:179 (+) Transcript_11155:70-606(+)
MGLCLSDVFQKKEPKGHVSTFAEAYPSLLLDESTTSINPTNDNRFYFIPNEDQIDKDLEFLENAKNYQEDTCEKIAQDLNQRLQGINEFYKRRAIKKEFSQYYEVDESEDFSPVSAKYPLFRINKASNQLRFAIFRIEVEKFKVFNEDFIKEKKFKKPFAHVSIYQSPSMTKYIEDVK